MTTFVNITDATLAVDKPITQDVIRGLRDNPKAIAEGDTSAPKIVPKAFEVVQAIASTKTVTSTTAGNGDTKLVFGTEEYDSAAIYNPATGVFTLPHTGIYKTVLAAWVSATASNGGELNLWKNYINPSNQGTLAKKYAWSAGQLPASTSLYWEAVFNGNAGDTLTLVGNANNPSALTLLNSNLRLELIGR